MAAPLNDRDVRLQATVPRYTPIASATNGLNALTVIIYQRVATNVAPALPNAAATVNFTTGVVTGLTNGWSTTLPSGAGRYLFASTAYASASTPTDSIAVADWNAANLLASDGTSGAAASLLTLVPTAQAITYNGAGVATPANQTISFTANLQNLVGTAAFACSIYNAAGTSLGAITMGGTGNTRTLTDAQFTAAASYAVVTASLTGFTDVVSVVRLADGAGGMAGYLTNENITVPTASDGSNAVLTGVTGNFKVFQGTTDVTAGCTFALVGSPLVTAAAPTNGTGAYSVTGVGTWANASMTTTVTYRATHTASGATIDKVLTITKAPSGASVTGARGAGQYYAVGSAWSDTLANSTVPAPKVVNDQVVISNSSTFTLTKRWDGSTWFVPGTYLDGSLFVTGTIASSAIDTRNLVVRDGAGNAIVGIGAPLRAGYEAPNTKNADIIIGGRNLYSKANGMVPFSSGATLVSRSVSGFTLLGVNANNGFMRIAGVVTGNGYYTVSFDLAVETTNGFPLAIDFCDMPVQTINPTTVVQHFSLTFNITNYSAATFHFLDFDGLSGQKYIFTNFKVEAGNKETAWTPSPDDVAADTALAATMATGVSLSSSGALSGGGTSGQVTLPGMGHNTFRVSAIGGAATGYSIVAGVYKNGVVAVDTNGKSAGYSRSYVVCIIQRSTGAILLVQDFDVYGSGANTQGRDAGTMANTLNAYGSDVIVVVYSCDEAQGQRLTGGLAAAMYRHGASRAVFGSPNVLFRSAYILVGIGGCGEGNGAEAYQGAVVNDPNAWCDVSFNVLNGSLIGVSANYTPKTLTDYGYVGDLNATVGAPTGTSVGGTDAGLVASRALNGDAAYNSIPGINSAISDKLSKTAASILGAAVTISTGGSIQVVNGNKSITLNGSGIAFTSAGVAMITFDTATGAATFRGDVLSAGTIAGTNAGTVVNQAANGQAAHDALVTPLGVSLFTTGGATTSSYSKNASSASTPQAQVSISGGSGSYTYSWTASSTYAVSASAPTGSNCAGVMVGPGVVVDVDIALVCNVHDTGNGKSGQASIALTISFT